MTGDLDAMFNAMLNNQVPGLWEKVGYPSLKPLSSWFEDMILRVDFFRDWIMKGSPVSYWVSAFYFPQGFLTSVLQGHSRRLQIPVDQLGWEFGFEETDDANEINEKPYEGIFIHGLFMDGCAWDFDEGKLADQQFGIIYCKAPVMNFIPTKGRKPDQSKLQMPVYKTSVRAGTLSTTGHSTNFVLFLEIDTPEPPNYWILKGAALLTMLND
jgi:dynein heavy chain